MERDVGHRNRMRSALLPGVLALVLAVLVPASGHGAPAGFAACEDQFANGHVPELQRPQLAAETVPLCYKAYAVLHSGLSRTPLYSAEHLTATRVEAAHHIRRVNRFHPEDTLPANQRAELSDYARSGYDRGHMAPSGDMPDATSQAESFSLANMVPQAPRLNRGVWEGIEAAVRDLVLHNGDAYVVTGPIFQGNQMKALKGRVLIPSDTFKAIYEPGRNVAGAYVCTNTDDPTCREVSLDELTSLSGIDVFPALSAKVKSAGMALPEAAPYGGRRRTRR